MTAVVTAPDRAPVLPGVPLVEVVVADRFDGATALHLRDRLEDALRVRPERLVVDLGGCTAFDASGLRVLLEVHCEAIRGGSRLVLRRAGERVQRVIALSGLDGVFDLEGA